MGLSKEELNNIRQSSEAELVRYAGTTDIAAVVKSNFRLKNSNEFLAKVIIFLTVLLVLLTAPLAVIEIYHLFYK